MFVRVLTAQKKNIICSNKITSIMALLLIHFMYNISFKNVLPTFSIFPQNKYKQTCFNEVFEMLDDYIWKNILVEDDDEDCTVLTLV